MVAITVKYHGPTDTRGSRYSATATANGQRVFISCDNALSNDQNKDKAALELCRKMNWIGNLIKGETADGTVYVFDDEQARVINPEVDRMSSTQAKAEYEAARKRKR